VKSHCLRDMMPVCRHAASLLGFNSSVSTSLEFCLARASRTALEVCFAQSSCDRSKVHACRLIAIRNCTHRHWLGFHHKEGHGRSSRMQLRDAVCNDVHAHHDELLSRATRQYCGRSSLETVTPGLKPRKEGKKNPVGQRAIPIDH
jgi:hypothetical protein